MTALKIAHDTTVTTAPIGPFGPDLVIGSDLKSGLPGLVVHRAGPGLRQRIDSGLFAAAIWLVGIVAVKSCQIASIREWFCDYLDQLSGVLVPKRRLRTKMGRFVRHALERVRNNRAQVLEQLVGDSGASGGVLQKTTCQRALEFAWHPVFALVAEVDQQLHFLTCAEEALQETLDVEPRSLCELHLRGAGIGIGVALSRLEGIHARELKGRAGRARKLLRQAESLRCKLLRHFQESSSWASEPSLYDVSVAEDLVSTLKQAHAEVVAARAIVRSGMLRIVATAWIDSGFDPSRKQCQTIAVTLYDMQHEIEKLDTIASSVLHNPERMSRLCGIDIPCEKLPPDWLRRLELLVTSIWAAASQFPSKR